MVTRELTNTCKRTASRKKSGFISAMRYGFSAIVPINEYQEKKFFETMN